MNSIESLVSRCKCGIHLTVNEHRDYYDSAEKTFADLRNRGLWDHETDPEIVRKMIETDTIVCLQFYPETPIGFYRVYHWSVSEAIKEALEILDGNHA